MGNHWPSFLVIFSWVRFLLDSVLVFSCSALRDFIFFLLSQVSYIWDGHELSTVTAIRIFVQPQKEAITEHLKFKQREGLSLITTKAKTQMDERLTGSRLIGTWATLYD